MVCLVKSVEGVGQRPRKGILYDAKNFVFGARIRISEYRLLVSRQNVGHRGKNHILKGQELGLKGLIKTDAQRTDDKKEN